MKFNDSGNQFRLWESGTQVKVFESDHSLRLCEFGNQMNLGHKSDFGNPGVRWSSGKQLGIQDSRRKIKFWKLKTLGIWESGKGFWIWESIKGFVNQVKLFESDEYLGLYFENWESGIFENPGISWISENQLKLWESGIVLEISQCSGNWLKLWE